MVPGTIFLRADYWLVEISGIPFGLFGGDARRGREYPWRGMVYGMTNRLSWCGDPRPIWKLWDDFGIRHARMIGYWEKNCPVRSGRNEVLATAYVRKGKTLVALASWAKGPVNCLLSIDWQALGLDPAEGLPPRTRDSRLPAAGAVSPHGKDPGLSGPGLAPGYRACQGRRRVRLRRAMLTRTGRCW